MAVAPHSLSRGSVNCERYRRRQFCLNPCSRWLDHMFLVSRVQYELHTYARTYATIQASSNSNEHKYLLARNTRRTDTRATAFLAVSYLFGGSPPNLNFIPTSLGGPNIHFSPAIYQFIFAYNILKQLSTHLSSDPPTGTFTQQPFGVCLPGNACFVSLSLYRL
jgi:hypothetical protein